MAEVTVLKAYAEGDETGKYVHSVFELSLELTAEGSIANPILAEELGLDITYIRESSMAVTDTNELIGASPNYAGTALLLYDFATPDTPIAVTDTVRVTIKGY